MTGERRLIAVVIPARDEAERIDACLASVRVAALAHGLPVLTIVVADGCLDDTVARARTHPDVVVIETDGINVGGARRAGVEAAIRRGATWIANTDADSTVPIHWLTVQAQHDRAGDDVVLGTVRPDFDELSDVQREAWTVIHADGRSIGNVHGANLGFRVSAYLAAGGFHADPEHEDVDLVARLRPVARVVATDQGEVVTSGRPVGRTPGGYARYLRDDLLRADPTGVGTTGGLLYP